MAPSPNNLNIFTLIRFYYPDMTKVEKKIANSFLEDPAAIASMSLADTARKCGCGEASIVRFCRHLGLESFIEARSLLMDQKDAASTPVRLGNPRTVREIADDICSMYVDTLDQTMQLNPIEHFETAVQRIAQAGSLYLFGIGDALVPCICGYYRFRRIGLSCFFDADADMQLIHAANIRKGDVVIASSHSGQTRHVIRAVKAARAAGAFVIGITQSSRSELTNCCDLLFYNAVADITVGKTIVAHRLAESTIMEIFYAGVVPLIPDQADRMIASSAEIMRVNKQEV